MDIEIHMKIKVSNDEKEKKLLGDNIEENFNNILKNVDIKSLLSSISNAAINKNNGE